MLIDKLSDDPSDEKTKDELSNGVISLKQQAQRGWKAFYDIKQELDDFDEILFKPDFFREIAARGESRFVLGIQGKRLREFAVERKKLGKRLGVETFVVLESQPEFEFLPGDLRCQKNLNCLGAP
eukprot:7386585-Prymnesium_polylepis.6